MAVRFILRHLLYAVPALVGIALYAWLYRDTFPAPRLTNNIAVNEQVDRLAHLPPNGVKVLAIGSSMTLNNLASAEAVAFFGPSFQNAGAWGIGAAELPLYGDALITHFKPAEVVVVTNLMDLVQGSSFTADDAAHVTRHLSNGSGPMAYLRHWNAPYYLGQMRTNQIRFNDPGNYEHLGYDAHGGSTLEVPIDRIDRSRYDAPPTRWDAVDSSRVAAFAHFADQLHARGIRLTVLVSPYRPGLRTTAVDVDALRYIGWLRAVLHRPGQRLVNGYEERWSDELYCDASHFDHDGARAFTQWCMQRLAADSSTTR
jgi:hypothetical protein